MRRDHNYYYEVQFLVGRRWYQITVVNDEKGMEDLAKDYLRRGASVVRYHVEGETTAVRWSTYKGKSWDTITDWKDVEEVIKR